MNNNAHHKYYATFKRDVSTCILHMYKNSIAQEKYFTGINFLKQQNR